MKGSMFQDYIGGLLMALHIWQIRRLGGRTGLGRLIGKAKLN